MRLPFGRVISPNIIMTTVDESVEESGKKKKKKKRGRKFSHSLENASRLLCDKLL